MLKHIQFQVNIRDSRNEARTSNLTRIRKYILDLIPSLRTGLNHTVDADSTCATATRIAHTIVLLVRHIGNACDAELFWRLAPLQRSTPLFFLRHTNPYALPVFPSFRSSPYLPLYEILFIFRFFLVFAFFLLFFSFWRHSRQNSDLVFLPFFLFFFFFFCDD